MTGKNKNRDQAPDQEQKNPVRYALPVKRPLGTILVDGKFIKPETLDAALDQQKQTRDLLGNILVNMGMLDPADLNAALMVQRDFSTIEDAINAAAGVRMMLGELLLASSRITRDQIEKALEEQKRTGEKIGEILVRLGLFSSTEMDIALSFQSRQNAGYASCLSLGELLIAAGYITHDDLEDALERQKGSNKKLGEILVDAGRCKPHHVEHGLRMQKQLVAAALIAALSLAPVKEAVSSVNPSSTAMTTNIKVTATVLARASMHVLRQPNEIVVTDADIKRGYLDISAGSLVEIKNNSRAGVDLTFETHGLPFSEVLVSGFGREVALGPNGGIITHQLLGANIIAFSYRFVFDRNSRAGTYAWPLVLSVSPVE
ncbi:MAG TPA: hypothetical protein PLJ49_06960 [Smithella sp.]|jgi:hypothetical protein|nr:hypothetical protein [Smithella sp.]OQC53914.1 MAG: bacteriophage N4 adsorption protein B [Deltaproteobacteria bacterium ADurb.Bin022]HOG10344.1 hypothetical protein [Smithella sp.]HOO35610.1 hypothetical protein [Smithella sp.]HOS14580.1 hypothetical protein [Smithella sp.]